MSAWAVLMWISAAAVAVGVRLNVRRDRRCFLFWSAANVIQIAYSLWLFSRTGEGGLLAMAALWSYCLLEAAAGWRQWAVDSSRAERAKPAPRSREVLLSDAREFLAARPEADVYDLALFVQCSTETAQELLDELVAEDPQWI